MILLIAILYVGYLFIKASIEDEQVRINCKNKGCSEYPSSTGLRDIKTGKKCYVNPRTGQKTFF